MKSFFVLVIFFLPVVFYGATPANNRELKYVNVAELPVTKRQITILPPAPFLSPAIRPATPFLQAATRKLTFREKLLMKLVKFKMRKFGMNDDIDPKKVRQGKIALIAGAAAFAFAIIPFVNLLSIPLALFAVIMGIISLQGNKNIYGVIGLCLGGLFILLTALVVLIVIALLV